MMKVEKQEGQTPEEEKGAMNEKMSTTLKTFTAGVQSKMRTDHK